MDFAPTPSQQLLIQTARSFLQQHWPPERAQALALEPGGFAHDIWKSMSTLGWPGLLIPPSLGGSGGTMPDVVALAEEMGRACLPSPFIPSAVVATSMLLAASCSPRARQLVPPLALGERICAVAVVEERGTYAPDGIALRAEAPGRLAGRKLFVKDAHVASDLIVIARGGRGLTALLLPMTRAGIAVIPLDAMGDEKLFEVAFADVDIEVEDLLSAADGSDLVAPAMRLGALARSAEMVGGAQRILELCVDYARVRVQSGRPIGAFQAIQHHCADLLRDVEASRWLVYEAAWQVAEGLDTAPPAVAMAKAFGADACARVARRAHQIMGAIGYCEEHQLHLLHKRILAAGLDWGDAALHLDTVAQSIGLV
jgi:alkylation response protein AidB-like acyl-CoA dehydrogenase